MWSKFNKIFWLKGLTNSFHGKVNFFSISVVWKILKTTLEDANLTDFVKTLCQI